MAQGIARGRQRSVGPSVALALVVDSLGGNTDAQFRVSLGRLLPKLATYLEARGLTDVRDVGASPVRDWIDAPLPDGSQPSLATRHNRRSAARLAFRILRETGLVDHDPTLDIDLPPRRWGPEARPLTDDEIAAGRAAALTRLGGTLRPAVWALAEATATTHEIPRVRPGDVDLESGLVRLSGSGKVDARIGELTPWGIEVLVRRLDAIGVDDHVAYGGTRTSAAAMQATASRTLGKVLERAGLRDDPSVLPGSVRAWTGRRVWLATGRIEDAALALGARTLDTAAAIIGLEWRTDR